jgi:hypothetical protein
MPIEKFKLPKGRIVGGHPIKAENKMDFHSKKPILDEQGKNLVQYRVELAIPKDVFIAQVYPYMLQEVATAFPMNPQTGQPNVSRDFSWKFVDGDSPQCPKGSKVPYNVRDGYPGHYVLTVKTEAFAPGTFVFRNGAYHAVQEHEIKCGDYVVANIDMRVHSNNDGGIYLNPNGFELVEIGAAIKGGGSANPDDMFGDASSRPANSGFNGVLPQQGAAMIGAPAQMMAPAPVAAMPMQQMAPAPMQAAPAPAYDLVQNAMGVQQIPQQQMAPAPVAAMPMQQPMMSMQGYAGPVTQSPISTPAYNMPGIPPQR